MALTLLLRVVLLLILLSQYLYSGCRDAIIVYRGLRCNARQGECGKSSGRTAPPGTAQWARCGALGYMAGRLLQPRLSLTRVSRKCLVHLWSASKAIPLVSYYDTVAGA